MASTRTVETAKEGVRGSLQWVGGRRDIVTGSLGTTSSPRESKASWKQEVVSDEQGLGSRLGMSVGLQKQPLSHSATRSSALPLCQALCLHRAVAISNKRPQPSESLSSSGRRELML